MPGSVDGGQVADVYSRARPFEVGLPRPGPPAQLVLCHLIDRWRVIRHVLFNLRFQQLLIVLARHLVDGHR